MSKSIIMVDTPEDCHKCKFCYSHRACMLKTYDSGCCCGGKIMEDIPDSGIPNWCPLAEIPDRLEAHYQEDGTIRNDDTKSWFAIGWNACLDRIIVNYAEKIKEKKGNG